MNKYKRSSGFTLVEVMLTLAAAAIIAMTTFFVYKHYSTRQDSYRATVLASQLIENIQGATSTAHCLGAGACGNYANLPAGATAYFLQNKVIPAPLLNSATNPTAATSPWLGTITFTPTNSPIAGALPDSLLDISFSKVPTAICSSFVSSIAPKVSKITIGSQVVQNKLGANVKLDPGTIASACAGAPTVVLTMDSPSAYAGSAVASSLGPDNGYTGAMQTYTLSCPVLDVNGQPTGATQPCFDSARMATITSTNLSPTKSGTCLGSGGFGSPGCYLSTYAIQTTQGDPSVHTSTAPASGSTVLPPFVGTPPPPPANGDSCSQKLNNVSGPWQPSTQYQTTWEQESQACPVNNGSGSNTWEAEYVSQRSADCADPNSSADPVWSAWSTPAPTGTTRNVVNTCTPTCMQLLLTAPWNSSPQTNTQWVPQSNACPAGDTGSDTWQAQQQQTRTALCANASSTDSPTWSSWSDWQMTGATQNEVNTCSPTCATQLSAISPNPQTNTQWVSASAVCPPGMIGSHTWEKQQTQSRTASCADPTSAAAPAWSVWSAWADTGQIRNEVNTCVYAHPTCGSELSVAPWNAVGTRNVPVVQACASGYVGSDTLYQPQTQRYACADPNALVDPVLGAWTNSGALTQGPNTCTASCGLQLTWDPWNGSPQYNWHTYYWSSTTACPAYQVGTVSYSIPQYQYRTSYCPGGNANAGSPAWTGWSGWINSGSATVTGNTCSWICSYRLSHNINGNWAKQTRTPPPVTTYGHQCPIGTIGTYSITTYYVTNSQTNTASCSDPNAPANPIWGGWLPTSPPIDHTTNTISIDCERMCGKYVC